MLLGCRTYVDIEKDAYVPGLKINVISSDGEPVKRNDILIYRPTDSKCYQ